MIEITRRLEKLISNIQHMEINQGEIVEILEDIILEVNAE